jgi:hypothetical protein
MRRLSPNTDAAAFHFLGRVLIDERHEITVGPGKLDKCAQKHTAECTGT